MALTRCSVGLHKWAYAKERADDQAGFVVCSRCGRRRSSGMKISMLLFSGFLLAAILVFSFWSVFLGAVMLIGAMGGLMWTMLPAVFDRVTRWLTLGR